MPRIYVTDVLLIGLSSVVTRRVLPALKGLSRVNRIDVATKKAADPRLRDSWSSGTVFETYEGAIKNTSAEIAYVSLVNSEHERWARAALEGGLHVIVDKPAFLGCSHAMEMLDLAARLDRCLAEATVFPYHPQMSAARQIFQDNEDVPRRITAMLSFPPMDPANFRYRRELGGGAMWDVGPYLVATGRVFFGSDPAVVDCRIVSRQADNLDVAFTAQGVFQGGCSTVGHFGFDTAYVNRLQMVGAKIAIDIDRAFTTPPDYVNTLRISGQAAETSRTTGAADAFGLFFDHVMTRIEAHDWKGLGADLAADARVLDRYRTAAGLA